MKVLSNIFMAIFLILGISAGQVALKAPKLVEQIEQKSDENPKHNGIHILNVIKPFQNSSLPHIDVRGNPLTLDKVNALYTRVMRGNDYEIAPRESEGHSPSYMLYDKETHKPFAILKQSDPEIFSSFTRHLPDLGITAPVWEHELIGYEQDQLFAFDNTPATLSVRFINLAGETVRGTIQEFIATARGGSFFYDSEGADLLKSIPTKEVHLLALSGIFKGLSAGHMENYILDIPKGAPENTKIHEIDLEEMLLPYNRINPEENPIGLSLGLCRMWIIGLPQSAQPFDRETLEILTNSLLVPLLEQYQNEAKTYSNISEASWNAQMERVQMMQAMAVAELKKEVPALTPRDLYFAIFGGERLWAIAQEKKYPAIAAFNNVLSDPYQHVIKDFTSPENIPTSTLLKKPKDDSKDALDRYNFYRKMESP